MKSLFKLIPVFFLGAFTSAWFGLMMPAWAAKAQDNQITTQELRLGTRLKVKDLKIGNGATATRYSQIKVHYTGWTEDGKKFDSSLDRGTPFSFQLTVGQVIPGWDMGIVGMRVGGKRELIIPPKLAYGKNGVPKVIPPNAILKFDVELLAVSPPRFDSIDIKDLKALLGRGVSIIDIRSKDEWRNTGIIKGSRLMTAFNKNGTFVRSFLGDLKTVAGPNDEVILISGNAHRSAALANFLSERKGYTKIHNVARGIANWIKAGNHVVKP